MQALLTLARRCRRVIGAEWLWPYVRPLYWGALTVLTARRGAALRLSDGQTYRLSPKFFAWQVDTYEPGTVKTLLAELKPDSVLYDIGAHVGFLTLMTARRLDPSRGRVLALEPAPANFAMLERHLAFNRLDDRVVARRMLVGDDAHEAVRFVVREDDFTANSLAYDIEGGEAVATPMTTVDLLVDSGLTPPPSHVKIDVEGFEAAVLRGAVRTLRNHRPWIICAMHPDPLATLGESTRAIVTFMRDFGYVATTVEGVPTDEPGFEEVVFAPLHAAVREG